MALEILEYDVIGKTSLNVAFRRRPTFVGDPSLPVPKRADGTPAVAVDAKGRATRMLTPPGPVVQVRIERSTVAPRTWARLLKAFDEIESVVSDLADAHVAAIEASPASLDAKINEAHRAVEQKHQEHAEIDRQLAEKRAELGMLEQAIAKGAPVARRRA